MDIMKIDFRIRPNYSEIFKLDWINEFCTPRSSPQISQDKVLGADNKDSDSPLHTWEIQESLQKQEYQAINATSICPTQNETPYLYDKTFRNRTFETETA